MIDLAYVNLVRELVAEGEKVEMEFSGSSMLPTIPMQCKILVGRLRSVEIGKVYVYISSDPYPVLVCHRLVELCGDKLYFCGDNRNCVDPPVIKETIIGRCIAYISDGKVFPIDRG